MYWDAIAATGEWAGAVAVVVTLIYLALQIRQQNKIAQYSAWQSVIDGFNLALSTALADKENIALWVRGLDDPDRLTDDEMLMFSNHFTQLMPFKMTAMFIAQKMRKQVNWPAEMPRIGRLVFEAGSKPINMAATA